MIETAQLNDELSGALVAYRASTQDPKLEYGLVQSIRHSKVPELSVVYVRFHLGDTAAGCRPDQLQVLVPAVRRQDRDELSAWRRFGEGLGNTIEAMPDGATKDELARTLYLVHREAQGL